MQYRPLRDGGQPTLLFYDSADARYYLEDSSVSEEMDFVDYASFSMDGRIKTDFIRKFERKVNGNENVTALNGKTYFADIFMVKQDDHLLVRIKTEERTDEITFAMYDASRYMYFTGDQCALTNIHIVK